MSLGFTTMATRLLSNNRKLRQRAKSFQDRKKELNQKDHQTYGLSLTPSARKAHERRMARARYYGWVREVRLQVIIYLAATALLYWCWQLLT